MDASVKSEELHRQLRNILRAKMRRHRELFGEDSLRADANPDSVYPNDEFVCFENKDEFVSRYPSLDEQVAYVERARSLESVSKKMATELLPKIERAFGVRNRVDRSY